MGVIHSCELQLKKEKIIFSTANFGSFQLVKVTKPIMQAKVLASTSPIMTAREGTSLVSGEAGAIVLKLNNLTQYYWKVELINQDGTVKATSNLKSFKTK